jgi:hypothetical protein
MGTQMKTFHADTVQLENRLDVLMTEIAEIKQILSDKKL